MDYPKRLIEVDLPIKRISAHARREKSIRHGHISTLHIWWARRPLAACRAVICASLWPDPADENCPQAFRDAAARLITEFAEKVYNTTCPARDGLEGELRPVGGDRRGQGEGDRSRPERPGPPQQAPVRAARLHRRFRQLGQLDRPRVPGNQPRSDPGRPRSPRRRAGHPAAGRRSVRRRRLDPAGSPARRGRRLRQRPQPRRRAAQQGRPRVHPEVRPAPCRRSPQVGRVDQAARPRRNWPSSTRKTPTARRPSPIFGRGRSSCEGPGCGAEVPLIRSLWLAKKANRSVACNSASAKAKRVDFQIIAKQPDGWVDQDDPKTKIEDPKFDGTVKRGSATCPCCGYTTPVARVRDQLKARAAGPRTHGFCVVVTIRTDGKDVLSVARQASTWRLSKGAA